MIACENWIMSISEGKEWEYKVYKYLLNLD